MADDATAAHLPTDIILASLFLDHQDCWHLCKHLFAPLKPPLPSHVMGSLRDGLQILTSYGSSLLLFLTLLLHLSTRSPSQNSSAPLSNTHLHHPPLTTPRLLQLAPYCIRVVLQTNKIANARHPRHYFTENPVTRRIQLSQLQVKLSCSESLRLGSLSLTGTFVQQMTYPNFAQCPKDTARKADSKNPTQAHRKPERLKNRTS